ncbi:ATP-grasp domain-containing protein [Dictyobacter arantiisoli]|uniref:ATP-grasp domain-containing protein n=1 Tax=Dictyobacter arantiisoli TaxID=2014874 RepID=UPI00155A39D0|nr:ATP-grasp domain-containing protein [Dictyobacter arantiisoli]
MGARLTLMINIPYITQEDIHMYERVIGLPIAATDEEWIEVAALINRIDPFIALGGFSEGVQRQTALIARVLDLPFHRLEIVDMVARKELMRQRLVDAEVDPTPAHIVQTNEEIKAFAAEYGYPLILKPNDGRGSTGILRISSADTVAVALTRFQEFTPQSALFSNAHFDMLVEPYLQGDELSVEAFSENGKHKVIAITQKFKEADTFIEIGHCIPASLTPQVASKIEHLVFQALTALEIASGPSHTEIILTDAGPRIVETHIRLGGDCIPELIQLVYGIDLLDLWARQVLGESVWHALPEVVSTHTCAAIWYVSLLPPGVVKNVSGVEEARDVSCIHDVHILKNEGDVLGNVKNSFTRGAYAIATASSPDKALSSARMATECLTFEIAENEEKE